jgi:hypothetical protein
LDELQQSLQLQLSYTFYAAFLRSGRDGDAGSARELAEKLIETHSADWLAGKVARPFRGKDAQDVSISVLQARLKADQDRKFHEDVMSELQSFAEIVASGDVLDIFSGQDFEAELTYSERAVDVIEARRRSDFQVYIAAIIAVLAA